MPPPQPVEREYVDISTAADFACCSKATIRRLLTAGQITRFKFCSRTLIRFSELRELVRAEPRRS